MTESDFTLLILAVLAGGLAFLPATLTWKNLRLFQRSPDTHTSDPVSILVPVRNEAAVLDGFIVNVLASQDVDFELVVLNDASTDSSAHIISEWSQRDSRVRLIHGKPLPNGWCGKQHACHQLAEAAHNNILVFIDADVTVQPDAIARSVAFLEDSKVDLASGFPHQETPTFLGWLLLPLIHFVLLGFLPLSRSRHSNSASLAAGCGQLFLTTRDAYRRAGGHYAIKSSLHDGIMLPRLFRRAGLRTDIFDASDLASCRMYDTNRDVLQGLMKNATEGIGSPKTIIPFTLLLGGGQVLPAIIVLIFFFGTGQSRMTGLVIISSFILSYCPRFLTLARFRQSVGSALFHPLAVGVFLGIQWVALGRRALGFKASWKGRALRPQ